MERGALGSELDGNPAEWRAIWSREDPRFLGTIFTLHRLQFSMLILCITVTTVVLRTYDFVFLSRSVLLCMRITACSVPLLSKRCSFR